MRKACLVLAAAAVAAVAARPAHAVLQFYKVFDEVYLVDHDNKEFAEAAREKKMQCLICHQGKLRKNHNPYGIHLVELLDKRKDVKDVAKIKEALAKVGEMHSDPKDESSPTYDELIKSGAFPGGTFEEASKEPPKKDEPSARDGAAGTSG
ncbi:MAG TPA: hypothetical protein VEQ85_07495 [Lacipirellulaceae bacterium]|nr:hypothetical protein [Lacipirellulaceae bacterium]